MTRCGECVRWQIVADKYRDLLVQAENREAKQRGEIGALEQRLTRHAPKWEPDASAAGSVGA